MFKGLDHCEILKKSFFYWLKKSFEPSRIRDKRSHTRPKSCSSKFRAITQAFRNAPKGQSAINRNLFGGFSTITYYSILNFSNTPTLCPLYEGAIKGGRLRVGSLNKFLHWKKQVPKLQTRASKKYVFQNGVHDISRSN